MKFYEKIVTSFYDAGELLEKIDIECHDEDVDDFVDGELVDEKTGYYGTLTGKPYERTIKVYAFHTLEACTNSIT